MHNLRRSIKLKLMTNDICNKKYQTHNLIMKVRSSIWNFSYKILIIFVFTPDNEKRPANLYISKAGLVQDVDSEVSLMPWYLMVIFCVFFVYISFTNKKKVCGNVRFFYFFFLLMLYFIQIFIYTFSHVSSTCFLFQASSFVFYLLKSEPIARSN